MTLQPSRRNFLFGAGAALAATAIVQASSIMRVRPLDPVVTMEFARQYNGPSSWLDLYDGIQWAKDEIARMWRIEAQSLREASNRLQRLYPTKFVDTGVTLRVEDCDRAGSATLDSWVFCVPPAATGLHVENDCDLTIKNCYFYTDQGTVDRPSTALCVPTAMGEKLCRT